MKINPFKYSVIAILFVSCLAGCGGKADPAVRAVRAAAEHIVKSGGSFILHGTTVPIKSASKIPPGNLSIQHVGLNGLHARDTDIELLKSLTRLEVLDLQSSYITDAGMVFLKDLKNLRELDLHDSQYFTDQGLESLQGLKQLAKLELSKTKITDGAVDRLITMKQLQQVFLSNTRISAEAAKKLKDGLPNCKILGPK